MRKEPLKYSVVIPVYNERQNIDDLYSRLTKVMNELSQSYEVIFVDDGSTDDTYNFLKDFAKKDAHIRIIRLSRNFGHQNALTAGLSYARGEAVALMDGDLQDPPEVLPLLFSKWKENFQIVYAVRRRRKENFLKKACYKLFYKVLRNISEVTMPLDAGDFCVMDKKVVAIINALPESERFLRGIRSWVGYRQAGVEYERQHRLAGKPKFTIKRLINLALQGFVSFSVEPLRIILYIGFFFSATAFAGVAFLILMKLFVGISLPGWTSLAVAIVFFGGVQLLCLSIVGEYIGVMFKEIKNRPQFLISETLNIDE